MSPILSISSSSRLGGRWPLRQLMVAPLAAALLFGGPAAAQAWHPAATVAQAQPAAERPAADITQERRDHDAPRRDDRPPSADRPPSGDVAHAKSDRERPDTARKLPADSTTDQTVTAAGRTLRFKATAGSIPLLDGDGGTLRAEIGYVAYVMPGAADRPVTFLFNGGPGAASAYLNIGAIGPWRLPLDGATPSSAATLVPNAETWLDFTDLVFVDPPGTGYSRLVGGDQVKRQLWSVDGDADALAVFVRKWLQQAGRQASPKFLVGESYGGFRVPKIARALASDQGIGVRGLVLISPVLDFSTLGQRRHQPMSFVATLPSMAATALELKNAFAPQPLAEAERYAAGEYLADLMKGERDRAAVDRITARVAALTGLDPALVRRQAGRIDSGTFQRELFRGRGLVGSAYDATVTAYDPTPSAPYSHFPDPVLDATKAPLTTAMTTLYRTTLGWSVEPPYKLLDGEIASHWNWGRGRQAPQVVDEVRAVLAGDRLTRLLVAHGASDLVTPYFANRLILDQLPAYGAADRAQLAVYRGGHMFYSLDDSRKALRRDAEALFRATLEAGPKE